MKKVNSKNTIAFYAAMARKFNFTIIQKNNSHLMPIVANALEVMKIADADEWMKRFALTIVEPITDQKWVYIPWILGNAATKSLISQNCILCHETEHTIQGEDIRFGPKYLTDKAYRANKEFKADIPQMILYKKLTGRTLNTNKLANILRYYSVRSRDIQVTKKKLDIVNIAIARGKIISIVGKYAVDWWEK